MGSIQSLLAIAALFLLSLLSVRFNSSVLENMSVEVENKVYLTAFSLGDDLIEEIKQKAFDNETVVFRSINPEELTPRNLFGPDAGENFVTDFNDIDDYHGYSRPVSLPHAEGYLVICNVDYVNSNNHDLVSLAQTFYKRIEVTVSSNYMRMPVKLSFVFTLHSK